MALYIFGYGSLLYPPGINGRVRKTYSESDLTEAWLYGYHRDWNATWQSDNIRYLGIAPSSRGVVNGVIFQLDEDDFEAFARSEGSESTSREPLYRFVDVRTQVGIFPESELILTPKDRILTCVTITPTKEGQVADYYIEIVKDALTARGADFAAEFWRTTPQPE